MTQALRSLGEELEQEGRGLRLAEVAGGFRLVTKQEFAGWIKRLDKSKSAAKLSRSALESLAIIAYKQPISRLQIASIRGVDPDAVMRTLHGRGYIAPIGRDDGPGQAVLWGTTDLFLEKLGIADIGALPPIASFVPDASIVEALEKTLRIDVTVADESAEEPTRSNAEPEAVD